MVSGQLPPSKIVSRLGLGFGLALWLGLGLGATFLGCNCPRTDKNVLSWIKPFSVVY